MEESLMLDNVLAWFVVGFFFGWLFSMTLNYIAEGIAKTLLKSMKTPGVDKE